MSYELNLRKMKRWLRIAAIAGSSAAVVFAAVKMDSIIFFVRSHLLPERYRYDQDVYSAMQAYKRDLFWHLREIRHSARAFEEEKSHQVTIAGLDEDSRGDKPEDPELRILEVCVNPLWTSNYQHFPYYSQQTIVCEDRTLRRVSEKRNYMSVGNLNSLKKFADKSFDAVVVTLMLCSSANTDAHVREIHRILVEGGHFYFLEAEPCPPNASQNAQNSVVAISPLRPLSWLLSWLYRPPRPRGIADTLTRNKFIKCEIIQDIYFPDTYPDRRFVLGFAIK